MLDDSLELGPHTAVGTKLHKPPPVIDSSEVCWKNQLFTQTYTLCLSVHVDECKDSELWITGEDGDAENSRGNRAIKLRVNDIYAA